MKIFIIHKSEYNGPGQAYRSKLLVIKKLWYFVLLGIRYMIASYWFNTFFYRLRIKDFTDLHQLVYITQTYANVSQRIVQYMYLKFSFALITYHKSKLSHATRLFLKSVIQYILYFFFYFARCFGQESPLLHRLTIM